MDNLSDFDASSQRSEPGSEPTTTITVDIVVPAYNEEDCIGELLDDLRTVKDESWFKVETIYVISDASTDTTDEIIQRAAADDVRIKLHRKPVRAGKTDSVNLAFSMSHADILVFIDADVRLAGPDTIARLLAHMRDEAVSLIQGNLVRSQRRITPLSLAKQAARFDSILAESLRRQKPISWWTIDGRVMALRRDFYLTLQLPQGMAEDQFIFYSCHAQGRRSIWADDAIFYYGPPESLADFSHQWSRYFYYTEKSRRYFGKKLVDSDMAAENLWSKIISQVKRHPLAGTAWLVCFAASRLEYLLRIGFDEYDQGLYRTESRPV